MELFEFTKILKEMVDFYERKEPKQGTIELWFEKVKRIPAEPIAWIMKRIQDEYDSFPKNLPSALWGAFREWQQANPDRMAVKQYFNCPDCIDGLIWARQIRNGIPYTYVFRCAKCRQDNTQAYQQGRRDELLADYEVMPKNGWPYTPKRARSMKDLTGDIGQLPDRA